MVPLDSNPYAIALHTSSPQLGLALSNFAETQRCQTWEMGRSLATHLHTYLAEFISPQTWQDFAFLAVAKGPGSFTGTRIGVVTARILAQQLSIPLFAISSLAAVAWSQPRHQTDKQPQAIALQMPAQRGHLFTAIYEITPTAAIPLLPDTVLTPEQWEETLATFTRPYQLIQVPENLGFTVSSLLELAHLEWEQGKRPLSSEALPFYGQHPVDQ
ncbi:tRNA (adenosine(37)-N6)-threonylcarbamoyltransferase complex dimerization subunit type 1 TsaB [Laspinema sp. A4]|uniref:tRNA (adenosine(37)-N6)-threonylcarbamoyltransferase complex dimerization subunit type 1 TsaB n=1 Tax=Laspinema sp. D2d TaxID=2953686 RepID=UPI0021BA6758|nr:tRNA (adenosine(37)-N6)-threonylcarbamoyltransferase complex dimerization subunit type 1 TsaB [Laspinema sp. D2d]MCT7985744.1 tRNA (adenosine(37)-N6)-threonylcarbamoyltransferase complex dimerization subunit type 1 TsaB [Laspinema sp. D2d]